MGTLIEAIRKQQGTKEIEMVSRKEGAGQEWLAGEIVKGRIVIPRNCNHQAITPIAIGNGMRVKINANIGTSPSHCDEEVEIRKVEAAIRAGADTIMDLSIAGDVPALRRRILDTFDIPVGTVPIYEAVIGLNATDELNFDRFLRVMESQARDGVDFMTIHAGLLKRHLPFVANRVMGIVSRGGALIAQWMKHRSAESFLYERFDDILEVAKTYDVTLSLGDGLRPGCTADANDAAQFGELDVIGELVGRCRAADVQVMVEGPGHVPMADIEENVRRQKRICDQAPFYVLGPLVIDRSPGYDHIAGAIGGAMAGMFGADFLCVVTPAEHLRLPEPEDVFEGVMASRIAASAADLARKRRAEVEANLGISRARKAFDWQGQKSFALDPEKFDRYLETVEQAEGQADAQRPCTMCGEWCAMKR
ncbi:phosphomethylpyrimidine synthase ThiC [Desulfatirhabdium butyrativorans]|uniref:phosphomethylpyrimidine synthase ThiC n=1 Tax=Desulfatirhabdium butyrativorans TaxID=340467 RepID=UPI0004230EA5|nr:phosphomethylpyrimidine synthase ThiC [Desulfatirhabdium butyrativorans]